ncbi:MAG: hypothetical protein HY607_10055 [Planctomycetes bacterium]|uniref:hypothetical protein n=1 Tax=Candidatus Wunengus californicus TaxID=3367619 RepID=UPI004024C102|nr:hypothetical protein [Planctomycetota bacterium]
MTKLLEKAFEEVCKLSEKEQNIVAKWLLEELAAERRWEKTFAESEDLLSQLADEALEEHRRGKTKLLNIDDL